jgi:hypothetical protein
LDDSLNLYIQKKLKFDRPLFTKPKGSEKVDVTQEHESVGKIVDEILVDSEKYYP